MTSSWIRAKACSSSRLAAARSAAPSCVGAAQPPQVHECRAHVLAALDELRQHIACDVDVGVAEPIDALAADESAQVVAYRRTHSSRQARVRVLRGARPTPMPLTLLNARSLSRAVRSPTDPSKRHSELRVRRIGPCGEISERTPLRECLSAPSRRCGGAAEPAARAPTSSTGRARA